MRRTTLALLSSRSLVLCSQASAQTCVGMPSFASGNMQVAGGGTFADGANGFGGTFGYGAPKGLYGKAGVGTTSYDGLVVRRSTSASPVDTRSPSRRSARRNCAQSRA